MINIVIENSTIWGTHHLLIKEEDGAWIGTLDLKRDLTDDEIKKELIKRLGAKPYSPTNTE